MFITFNSGSVCVCVCVYIYNCLILFKPILVEFVNLSIFHLISSLARTSCNTGLNEPNQQSLEDKCSSWNSLPISLSLSVSVCVCVCVPQGLNLKCLNE